MNRVYIDEAKKSKEATKEIKSLLWTLTSHVIKCWYMKESGSYNHWLGEIRDRLIEILESSRVKTKKGVLSQKICTKEFRYIYDNDFIENIIDDIEDEYDEFRYIDIGNISDIRKRLAYFYENLWHSISMKRLNIREFLVKMEVV